MTERRITPAKASLELDGTMSHRQVADALDRMIFTAAKDWTRTVRMDSDVRDLIVTTLRLAYGGNRTPGEPTRKDKE